MSEIEENDRTYLLNLARSVIGSKLGEEEKNEESESGSRVLKEKRGCFVTLHKRGQLRGCIGTIEPVTPLAEGVEENALNAAFRDPRFPPLTRDELGLIDIEVSVLTVPKPLEFKDGEELLEKLKPGVHGVILSRGWKRSTFLPQVWKQLPDKKIFLEHLCQKGGMGKDCWKDPETEVKVYKAEYFEER